MQTPFGPGDETNADNIDHDRPPVGNSHAMGTLATASPIWPTKSNLVHVPGTLMSLSQQSLLVKVICHDSFENLRKELLFKCAFAHPEDVPTVKRDPLHESLRIVSPSHAFPTVCPDDDNPHTSGVDIVCFHG